MPAAPAPVVRTRVFVCVYMCTCAATHTVHGARRLKLKAHLPSFLPSFSRVPHQSATMYVPGVDFIVNCVLCGAILGRKHLCLCVLCALRCRSDTVKWRRERGRARVVRRVPPPSVCIH
jgi:hypothetical protein